MDAVAPMPSQTPVEPTAGANDLRSKVSSLAQAMGSFAVTGEDPATAGIPSLSAAGSSGAPTTTATLAVVSMADVMKQFDANGQALGSSAGLVSQSLANPSNLSSDILRGKDNAMGSGLLVSNSKPSL